MLQVEVQNAQRQTDELKARNREIEVKLLIVGTGKTDTISTKQNVTKCVVAGDSVVRSIGAEHADMKVECFPGIKTEQLHRVMEKRDLGSSEIFIINLGTNDL